MKGSYVILIAVVSLVLIATVAAIYMKNGGGENTNTYVKEQLITEPVSVPGPEPMKLFDPKSGKVMGLEALITYFIRLGITSKKLLDGKLYTPKFALCDAPGRPSCETWRNYGGFWQYFYPLLLVRGTRDAPMTVKFDDNDPLSARVQGMKGESYFENTIMPPNLFAYRSYPVGELASSKAIVKPNFDTIYNYAWLDLSAGPIVIYTPRVPNVPKEFGGGKRYWSIECMSAWTDVYAMPGNYSGDPDNSLLVITGPSWRKANKNVDLVKWAQDQQISYVREAPSIIGPAECSTDFSWILVRLQCNNEDDFVQKCKTLQTRWQVISAANKSVARSLAEKAAHCTIPSDLYTKKRFLTEEQRERLKKALIEIVKDRLDIDFDFGLDMDSDDLVTKYAFCPMASGITIKRGGVYEEVSTDNVITKLGPRSFFELAFDSMVRFGAEPVHDPQYQAFLEEFGLNYKIGMDRSKHFSWEGLSPEQRQILKDVHSVGPGQLLWATAGWSKEVMNHNFYQVPLDLGVYDRDYITRAIAGFVGLGANPAKDSVYFVARGLGSKSGFIGSAAGLPGLGSERILAGRATEHLRNLDASIESYKLVFVPVFNMSSEEVLPPAEAFWSLTMYDTDGYGVPNTRGIHSIGSLTVPPLESSEGGITIYISHEPPAEDSLEYKNWLPAPNGPFSLTMRLYVPGEDVLNKHWSPPALEIWK